MKQHGYYTLTCSQFYEWISGANELTGKPVLLTFDDGELSQLNLVAPLLKKYQYHGICFVVGKHYAGNEGAAAPANSTEDAVTYFTKQQFDERGFSSSVMELGSHTYKPSLPAERKASGSCGVG